MNVLSVFTGMQWKARQMIAKSARVLWMKARITLVQLASQIMQIMFVPSVPKDIQAITVKCKFDLKTIITIRKKCVKRENYLV